MTGRATGLAVVAVYVDDLAAALDFYCRLLGFEELEDMAPGKLLGLGDLRVYVEPGRTPRDRATSARLERSETVLALLCEGVLALRTHLEFAGVPVVGDPESNGPGFTLCRVLDPAGNVVELAGRP